MKKYYEKNIKNNFINKHFIYLFVFLISLFVGGNSFSQNVNLFDVDEIEFVDKHIKNINPVAMEISDDTKSLIVVSNEYGKLKLLKYNCQTGNIVFAKNFNFDQFYDFRISPDNKNLLLINSNGILYYWPDFENTEKFYNISDRKISEFFFASNSLIAICYSGGKCAAFNIDTWDFIKTSFGDEVAISNMRDIRSKMIATMISPNNNYVIYFGNNSNRTDYGMWIKNNNVSYPPKMLLSMDDLGYGNHIRLISPDSKIIVYEKDNNIIIKNAKKVDVKYWYFCFELKYPLDPGDFSATHGWNNEAFQRKLNKGDYIIARVCNSKVHPITGTKLGAGDPKVWIQIIKIENNTLFCRINANVADKYSISEDDFIDKINGPYDSNGNVYDSRTNSQLKNCIGEEYKNYYYAPPPPPPPPSADGSTNDTEYVVEEYKIEISKSESPIFTVVEEMPSFIGGDSARIKFINDNLNYPLIAKENGIQGTVYLTFIVDVEGKPTDVRVLRGIGGGCDEEAIRIVKLMPAWNPGKQNGKTVNVQFNMPIRFTF